MSEIKKINDKIFSIHASDDSVPMIFVSGKNNFLINCGASEKDIDYVLIPSLKKLGISIKSIHSVVFTECSKRTVGGAYRLRQVAAGAKFLTLGSQSNRLKNPTYYENNSFSICPDYAPPMREIKGVFVDGDVDLRSRSFEELLPLPTPGHEEDCVCWYHVKTKTLICGESIQGDGSAAAGCAVITDAEAYRLSLTKLAELEIENLVCSPYLRGISEITSGTAQCSDAIHACLEIEESYEKFAEEYVNSRKSRQLPITLEELTSSYFAEKRFKPQFLGYSMLTFKEYIKDYL